MILQPRVVTFAAIATALTIGAGVYVAIEVARASARSTAPPEVAVTRVAALDDAPRVVFRNTEVGSKYGLVSMVSLADPAGPRAFTDVACDRVYATSDEATCLRTKRGIATTFQGVQLDADWNTVTTWALPGLPSRTRISADGKLLATTSFVTGHSYMQAGFSTDTEIRSAGGRPHGNLEKFTLRIDGRTVNPVDRNVWGVTFGADDDTFYATVATGGETFLVRGSLAARTLTAIRRNVECPSLSPDGSRIAFKQDIGGSTPRWRIAVLDLATERVVPLTGESHSVDDQVEWLDDDTLLYGLPRSGDAGVSDIWEINTNQGAEPSLFIEQAWSPSVVRS
jgi:dipeptidyl aminopeptidase/acylaminoacyl peptidase